MHPNCTKKEENYAGAPCIKCGYQLPGYKLMSVATRNIKVDEIIDPGATGYKCIYCLGIKHEKYFLGNQIKRIY